MLNKLLKRCMPWMDKGRWYTITFEVDNNNISVLKKDDGVNDTIVSSGSAFESHIVDIKNTKKGGPLFVSVVLLNAESNENSQLITAPSTPRVVDDHVGYSVTIYKKNMLHYIATLYIWCEG